MIVPDVLDRSSQKQLPSRVFHALRRLELTIDRGRSVAENKLSVSEIRHKWADLFILFRLTVSTSTRHGLVCPEMCSPEGTYPWLTSLRTHLVRTLLSAWNVAGLILALFTFQIFICHIHSECDMYQMLYLSAVESCVDICLRLYFGLRHVCSFSVPTCRFVFCMYTQVCFVFL